MERTMPVDDTASRGPRVTPSAGRRQRVGSRTRLCGSVVLAATLCTSAVGFMSPAAHAAPPEVWTNVRHDTTYVQHFDDDPCGRGAVVETLAYRTEMQHLTRLPDGSFHFVDFETGRVHEDWADPAVEDRVYRLTNTFSINLTPGGVFTRTETFRQSDGAVSFIYRYRLTEVDGRPVVEKEVDFFPYPAACPV
jgi:hypothetical protein